jgi:hypothetical protein
VDNNCLIMGMVSKVFEEDPPAEQGKLESLDIDVCMEGSPSVGPYGIGDDSREEPVQVTEKKDCPSSSCQLRTMGVELAVVD